jgi:hypothetical protein
MHEVIMTIVRTFIAATKETWASDRQPASQPATMRTLITVKRGKIGTATWWEELHVESEGTGTMNSPISAHTWAVITKRIR